MFEGDSVTLTCRGPRFPGSNLTLWHFKDKLWKSTYKKTLLIKDAEETQTGKYECQIQGSPRSNPVQLTVSKDQLILQAPPYAVFERDLLVLKCRGWKDRSMSKLRAVFNTGAEGGWLS
ncbi:Fc receptor-like B [Alligator mississippiensis]|uniref:Fc receptor-like B n=1 Tax=Alligator mississippiensis TaxID=8496 RepID=A0A151NKP5_ALLMI|nr:Fc receptor-like B [Alligator mississippiensis]